MYYIVFLILFYFSVVELFKKKVVLYFEVAYLLMTYMVMFRYGQLTDYFNYRLIYENPTAAGISDPLYFAVTEFLNLLGINYVGFVMLQGFLTMALMYPFFAKSCEKSIVALFVFYCYVFLILPMSAARQGFCLALLLYMYSLLVSGKKTLFYVTSVIGSFWHISMISVVIIGLLYNSKWYNKPLMSKIVIGITIFSILTPDISSYIPAFFMEKSLGDSEGSKYLQIIIRALLILPVMMLKPKYGTHGYYAKGICIIGYCIYSVFSFFPTAAARIEFYFRVFLCLYVAFAVYNMRSQFVKVLLCSIILIHSVLFFKNVDAAIDQQELYDRNELSMFNFPYISIFDKESQRHYLQGE